jgi:hypothetical protein
MRRSTASITKLLPRFETRRQVIERQKELIQALTGGDPAARRLARKVKKCVTGEPCKSAICPVCVRTLRRSFIVGVSKRIRKLRRKRRLPITAFSAILIADKYRPGKLHRADLSLINKRLQQQYLRAKLPLVFAGIDVSLNEDSQRQSHPLFWQIHVYGVVFGLSARHVKGALKDLYPADKSASKPFMAKDCCTYLPKALNYAIKTTFIRRARYIDDQDHLNTRKVSLKRPQLRELATWLDQYPLSSRYLLTGCRRYGDRVKLNPGVKKRLSSEMECP